MCIILLVLLWLWLLLLLMVLLEQFFLIFLAKCCIVKSQMWLLSAISNTFLFLPSLLFFSSLDNFFVSSVWIFYYFMADKICRSVYFLLFSFSLFLSFFHKHILHSECTIYTAVSTVNFSSKFEDSGVKRFVFLYIYFSFNSIKRENVH